MYLHIKISKQALGRSVDRYNRFSRGTRTWPIGQSLRTSGFRRRSKAARAWELRPSGGALRHFAKAEGFEVVREFVEVETGKGADALDRRPQLKAALGAARKLRCHVAVAKLDRLSSHRRCRARQLSQASAVAPRCSPHRQTGHRRGPSRPRHVPPCGN
jgi:hypothetical protein